ncbi:MAG: hypothetical protein A2020_02615 [Lentisphaerae bacterium GWF2_45_14]|nr:MAG: hypothetical protein A2020_02615 [Lentisphaerae bacterium GWF2_45_14]
MKKTVVAIFLFAVCFSGNSNILRNASFEEKVRYWESLPKSEFTPKQKEGIDASNCLELKKGCVYQTLYHSYLYPDMETGPYGRFYSFSFMAKGKGKLEFKVAEFSKDEKGKYKYNDVTLKTAELSDKWQKFEITGQAKDPRCVYHRVLWQTSGDGYALIDGADFHYFQSPDCKMGIEPQCAVAAKGNEIPLEVSFHKKSIPCPEENIDIIVFDSLKEFGGEIKTLSGKTDKQGIFKQTLKIPENFSSDGMRVTMSIPNSGITKNVFIPVFPEEEIKETNEAASKIKLGKPLFILYLGDSLSDYFRGRNYASMTNYFLNKYNTDKASFKNAAAGGDYITRVWERIEGMKQGKKPVWRQYMYENLLTPKPDIIFIFLGQNDTRTFSGTNYSIPLVTPDIQYSTYKKLISFLRKNTDARIVLISSVSIYFPTQLKIAEESKKKGVANCIFGQKEHLESFNSTLKKIAEEEKLDYIDAYSATQNYPDKKSLFISDGLHLSEKGNFLITKIIINYMNKEFKQKENHE